MQALTTSSSSVTLFSPDVLRKALLSAGKIVKPDEVSAVLGYATSDKKYRDLHGLHLILLSDGSIEQIKWDSSGGNKYFVFTDAMSKSIYGLMKGNKHQLVKTCSTWETLSRGDVGGIPLLESKHLNVMVPTLDDLGPSLPPSWQHDVCKKNAASRGCHPTSEWIERFWALIASTPGVIPANLHSFALVPITRHQLASIQHCIKYQALSQAHLQSLPSYATRTLSSIGCVCMTDARADRVSPIDSRADPLITALVAALQCLGVAIPQMLSQLGNTHFRNARQLLADHVQSSPATWSIIRQCHAFEDTTGRRVALDVNASYAILPCASWEEHIVQLGELLPWTPIKFHTASAVQRKLVSHSGLSILTQASFLECELLPAINRINSSSTEPLLLKAIGEKPGRLTNIFVDGYLHPIKKTVDSSNSLLQTLFSRPCAGDDYRLLPQRYCTPASLATLKQHGLAHFNTPETDSSSGAHSASHT
ncbi:hypothetical protein ABBQ38_006829 [Trebouxia sp. C0009 RCD-2024]